MKKLYMTIMAMALVLGLTACGGNNNASAPTVSDEQAANATEVKVVASNFEFDQTEYKVKKGEPIKLVLENAKGYHGIEIDGLDVKLEGSKMEQVIVPSEAGEYEIVCSVMCGTGHKDMKAKLIVE